MDAEQRQARRLTSLRAMLLRDVDRIWADLLDPRDVPGSLQAIGPLVVARIRVAQSQGLDAAAEYADAALRRAFGDAAIGVAMPAELLGFDRRGRALATMAVGAAEVHGQRMAAGMDPGRALDVEQAFWRRIAGSAVHDTARAGLVGLADPASGWSHPQVEGWARVAEAGACDFCRMLAGRGYAYTSRETAARAADGSRYHDHCRCMVSIGPAGTRDATAEQQYRAWQAEGSRTQWGRSSSGAAAPAIRAPAHTAAELHALADKLEQSAALMESRGLADAAAKARTRAAQLRTQAGNGVKTGGAPPGAATPDPVFGVIPKQISPDEALKGTNPHYTTGKLEYQQNCTRSIVAFEARRRGIDVQAASLATPDILHRALADATFRLPAGSTSHDWTAPGSVAALKKSVAAAPVGSRHWAYIAWPGGKRSHVFVAENRNGIAILIDPQSGTDGYSPGKIMGGTAQLLRVDDLDFASGADQFTIET